jgi:hypothetical protein
MQALTASATPANVSLEYDDFDLPVRRRFPLWLVFLLLGGAVAFVAFAVKNKWIGASSDNGMAVVPPADSSKTGPAASESGHAPPPSISSGATQPAASGARGREAPRDGRDRPRRERDTPPSGPVRPSDNPYRDLPEKPAPAPAPAPAPTSSDFGF